MKKFMIIMGESFFMVLDRCVLAETRADALRIIMEKVSVPAEMLDAIELA